MKDNIIETKGLYKYFNNKKILDGIDLEIRQGEKVVIIGPSGSGKSTLLRSLNLLEVPQAGCISFSGKIVFEQYAPKIREDLLTLKKKIKEAKHNLETKNEYIIDLAKKKQEYTEAKKHDKVLHKQRIKNSIETGVKFNQEKLLNSHRQKMGMVFQSFNLFPHLTVMENLILAPTELKLMTKEEATKKALAFLDRISLVDKKDSYPSQLSGGQKQRIAIIRSLINNPSVMLFDEPTSALDPEMVKEVLDFIRELAHEIPTMVIVTHEMGFAKEIGTRILFMDEGLIIEDKNPKEFFSNPTHERVMDFLSKVL